MSTLIIERPDLTNKHKHGRDEISLVFDKYDTDKSGLLDKEEIASVPIRSSTHADPSTHALGFAIVAACSSLLSLATKPHGSCCNPPCSSTCLPLIVCS